MICLDSYSFTTPASRTPFIYIYKKQEIFFNVDNGEKNYFAEIGHFRDVIFDIIHAKVLMNTIPMMYFQYVTYTLEITETISFSRKILLIQISQKIFFIILYVSYIIGIVFMSILAWILSKITSRKRPISAK